MRRRARRFRAGLLIGLTMGLGAASAEAVTIKWVTVGDPGNACDTSIAACFGSVGYTYRISKYEITNAQYAEFLKAVAATDTNGLYNTAMGTSTNPLLGGIMRSGSLGSFTYTAIAGRENMPVNHVSFYDSLRFANWLHNGRPTGAQENATTEDGAYTITSAGISNGSITRNAGGTIFLPSEDEWHKAAYYDALSMSYFDYPADSDVSTTCAAPGATANTSNCSDVVGDVTIVGSYTGSASPTGTFDQGGNVWEWTERGLGGSQRSIRGGSFISSFGFQSAIFHILVESENEVTDLGFRVASIVPEPGTGLLVMTGLLGLGFYRRRRG